MRVIVTTTTLRQRCPPSKAGFRRDVALARSTRTLTLQPSKDPSAIDVPDVPDEQEVIFLEDVRTCRDENGLQIAEPTREDVIEGYHALVELKSCLAGLGYVVPDPPSLDAYLDVYPSGDAGGWHPYALLEWGQLTQQEQDRIQEECPQP